MTEKTENPLDMETVAACYDLARSLIQNMCVARYHDTKPGDLIMLSFIKTVMVNLAGNFILEFSNKTIPGAVEMNTKDFIFCLNEFFITIEKKRKENH